MTKNKSFLIVGLGLLGGSIAIGLKKWNHKIYAIDTGKNGGICFLSDIQKGDF